ncbi:hypothetical protein [Microbacterium sp. NPDC057650]|uniref:hypothetical protein n=1 Tax=unclassified Microbacterium TaxID=2609290 RepID=UPI00366E85E2
MFEGLKRTTVNTAAVVGIAVSGIATPAQQVTGADFKPPQNLVSSFTNTMKRHDEISEALDRQEGGTQSGASPPDPGVDPASLPTAEGVATGAAQSGIDGGTAQDRGRSEGDLTSQPDAESEVGEAARDDEEVSSVSDPDAAGEIANASSRDVAEEPAEDNSDLTAGPHDVAATGEGDTPSTSEANDAHGGEPELGDQPEATSMEVESTDPTEEVASASEQNEAEGAAHAALDSGTAAEPAPASESKSEPAPAPGPQDDADSDLDPDT